MSFMRNPLHDPDTIARLRPYKDLFNRLRGFGPYRPEATPSEQIARMNGKGVFLISFGRSGTTVFRDFISSHPDAVSFGEVLNEEAFHSFFNAREMRGRGRPARMQGEFYRFMRRKLAGVAPRRGIFDMKIESLHLIEGNWRLPGQDFVLFDALCAAGAPVIMMERRDQVARHLSLEIAERRGRFHSFQGGAEIEPFTLDIAKMQAAIAVIDAQHRRLKQIFTGHSRFLHVVYEDMFDAPDENGARRFRADLAVRCGALMDADPAGFRAEPRLERVGGSGAMRYIANADEVEACRARLLAERS
jgi:hypothetical protein